MYLIKVIEKVHKMQMQMGIDMFSLHFQNISHYIIFNIHGIIYFYLAIYLHIYVFFDILFNIC